MNKLEDLEKVISELQKLKDDGVIPLFADGMLKAYNDLLPLVKKLTIPDVVKSLPNDEEVKSHIDTLPYYGTCTTEYNEGFEDGVKWLKEQLAK